MLNALNEVLRDDFIKDSVAGVGRWNKVHREGRPAAPADGAAQGVQPQHRRAGRRHACRPTAASSSEAEWKAQRGANGCRRAEDRAFVASLMGRVVEPGRFANWIAPPAMGINRQPVDFEYVRFD